MAAFDEAWSADHSLSLEHAVMEVFV